MARTTQKDLIHRFLPAHILLCGVVVAGVGCRPDPSLPNTRSIRETSLPAATRRQEGTWRQQIEGVRYGTSKEIVISQHEVVGDEWLAAAAAGERLQQLTVENGSVTPQALSELSSEVPNLTQLKLGFPVGNDHLDAIATFSSLKVLNLPKGEFDDRALPKLKSLPELELLRFHSPNVSDEGLREIAALPALRFLHLIDVPITDEGLVHIAGMSKLESFYLDGGGCTEEGLSELVKQRRDLHFHWNDLHLPDDPQEGRRDGG